MGRFLPTTTLWEQIYQNFHNLKEKIYSIKQIEKLTKELNDLEKQITLFHAEVVDELCKTNKINIIGFHGQTIYHNAEEKVSRQLGDGKLLSQLTKKDIVKRLGLKKWLQRA